MGIRVLISFCVFVVTGCLADPCRELRTCTARLTGLDTANGAPLTGLDPTLTADDYLHDTCTTLAECHQKTGECTNSLQLLTLTVGDYVCHQDNREQIRDMFESPCATNVTVQQQLVAAHGTCMTTYLAALQAVQSRMQIVRMPGPMDFSLFCPALQNFRTCMINTGTEVCGEATGTFSAQMFVVVIENALPSQLRNCFAQVQMTRRALETFMPHLAKKHFSGEMPFW